jgi:hypothetical protein
MVPVAVGTFHQNLMIPNLRYRGFENLEVTGLPTIVMGVIDPALCTITEYVS